MQGLHKCFVGDVDVEHARRRSRYCARRICLDRGTVGLRQVNDVSCCRARLSDRWFGDDRWQNIALDEKGRTALRKKVGIVFQKYNLLPTLTAHENIEIALHIAGKRIQWGPHFQEIVKLLGIADRLDHKPRAMSGGEQQRVAIARAIVNEPSILLADEPTGNLDSKNSEAVLELLRDLNRRLGQTIVMITHNPEAAAYGDRIVKMRDGLIVA